MANNGIDTKALRGQLNQLQDAQNEEMGFGGYAKDVLKGVWSGATDAVEETLQFGGNAIDSGIEGAGWLFGKEWTGIDGRTWDEGYHMDRLLWEPPRPTTGIGQFADDITQFGVGFVGAGKFTKAGQLGTKMFGAGSKAQVATGAIAKSAISSTVAHNPYEQRLSDIVQEIPALQNPITDFLQSDEDDTMLERRLKMAGEDIALGLGIEGVLAFARAAKRFKRGENPETVEQSLKSELETATETKKKARQKQNAEATKAKNSAEKEQKKISEAAAAGKDTEAMPREATTAWMADVIENEAVKSGRSRTDVLLGETKGQLATRAEALGIKVGTRDTKKTVVQKLETTMFPEGKKFTRKTTVEVEAPATKTGVQKPKGNPKFFNATAAKTLAKAAKNPRDIQTVFDDTKGSGIKLFNRTQDGDVPIVNYTDEVTSAIQETVNAFKPMLTKVKGKQTVDDLFNSVAQRMSESTGLTAKDWQNQAFAFGKSVEEATVALHAMDSMLMESGTRLHRLFADKRWDANPELQLKGMAELEHFGSLLAGIRMIETPLGRGLRMRKEKIFDANELMMAAKDLGGKEGIEKFRAVVLATGGDYRKVARAAAELSGRGASWKGAAMTGELFRSMILFNIKTHVTNTLSGFTETVLVPMEKYVGSYLTVTRNPFGAEQAAIRDDVVYHLMGLGAGFKDSISYAAKALRAERNILDPAATKLDGGADTINKISSSFVGLRQDSLTGQSLDIIGKLTRGSLRALGGEDEFFKQINYRARIYADAYREGKALMNTGALKDKEALKAHISKRMSEAFDDVGRATNKDALQYSREITFTEELRQGSAALKLQRFTQDHPTMQLFLPFVRTPTNLIVRGVQRTPLANLASRKAREAIFKGSPEEKAQYLGRVALGSTLLGGMAYMALEGRLTGAGPAIPDQNKVWRAAGNQPYSLKIGDKWYSYNRFDPVMMPIGLMANMFDMSKHLTEADREDLFATTVFALSTTIQDKAYLQGLANLMDALQTDDPRSMASISNIAENTIASFIPAAPLQVAEGLEAMTGTYPELREAIGLSDKIARRLPVQNKELSKKYNWLTGEVITNPDPYSTGFPVVPDKTTERVGSELVALRYPFKGVPRTIEGIELQTEHLSEWSRLMGTTRISGRTLMQSLDELMRNPRYGKTDERVYDGVNLTSEIKAITDVLSAYRQQSRMELYRKFPDLYKMVQARQINDRAGRKLLETNR